MQPFPSCEGSSRSDYKVDICFGIRSEITKLLKIEEILKLQRQFGFSEKDLRLALDVPEGTY